MSERWQIVDANTFQVLQTCPTRRMARKAQRCWEQDYRWGQGPETVMARIGRP